MEALLDREHGKGKGKGGRGAGASSNSEEEEGEEALRRLYARAMVLEYDFFAEHWQRGQPKGEEWRGIDPGAWFGLVCWDCAVYGRVRAKATSTIDTSNHDTGLLVTDFDSTCSREDTTHVLAKVRRRLIGPHLIGSIDSARRRSPSTKGIDRPPHAHHPTTTTTMPTPYLQAAGHFKGPNYSAERWAALEQNYLTQLSEVLPPLLEPPDEAARARATEDPSAYLARLDAFETRLVDTVSDSGASMGGMGLGGSVDRRG